jgi:hypothetical protein
VIYTTQSTRGATALPERPPRPAAWTDVAVSAELARGQWQAAAWDAYLADRPYQPLDAHQQRGGWQ